MSDGQRSNPWLEARDRLNSIELNNSEYEYDNSTSTLTITARPMVTFSIRAFDTIKKDLANLRKEEAQCGPDAIRIIEGRKFTLAGLIRGRERILSDSKECLVAYFHATIKYISSGFSILRGDKSEILKIYQLASQAIEIEEIASRIINGKEILNEAYHQWQKDMDAWQRYGKINDKIRDTLNGHSGVKFFKWGGELKSIWTILGYSASKDTSQLQMQGVLRHICAETHLTSDDFEEYCKFCERRNSGVQVKAANERRREDLQHLKDYELLCQIALGIRKM